MTEAIFETAQAVLTGYDTALNKQFREEDRKWRVEDLAWRDQERFYNESNLQQMYERSINLVAGICTSMCVDVALGRSTHACSGNWSESGTWRRWISVSLTTYDTYGSATWTAHAATWCGDTRHPSWCQVHIDMKLTQEERSEQLKGISNLAALVAGFAGAIM